MQAYTMQSTLQNRNEDHGKTRLPAFDISAGREVYRAYLLKQEPDALYIEMVDKFDRRFYIGHLKHEDKKLTMIFDMSPLERKVYEMLNEDPEFCFSKEVASYAEIISIVKPEGTGREVDVRRFLEPLFYLSNGWFSAAVRGAVSNNLTADEWREACEMAWGMMPAAAAKSKLTLKICGKSEEVQRHLADYDNIVGILSMNKEQFVFLTDFVWEMKDQENFESELMHRELYLRRN